ncbi:MAG: hydrolase [Marinilabilia sp.]
MRILKDHALGMVVDVQEKLFPHIYDHEQIARNIGILIEGLQALNVPVVVTEQYKKGLGGTIPSLARLVEKYPHGEKNAFSCCDDPAIMESIELSSRRDIILAGIESHICLLQTAIDLKERGYRPVVIGNCVGSRKPEDTEIALTRLKQENVLISSYESILFELCRFSGTEQFKVISKLVK